MTGKADEDGQDHPAGSAATIVAAAGGRRPSHLPSDISLRPLSPESLASESGERYELGDSLGAGGMGAVLRARDRQLGRVIALKVMHRSVARDPDFVRRFIMEAQVTAQLEHPAIVPTYSLTAGEDGTPRLAMRLIPGQTLQGMIDTAARRIFRSNDPLDGLRERLTLFATACGAVHFAHERGVLHRDLKPENIMVGRHGDAYVVDWGLAKLRQGEVTADRRDAGIGSVQVREQPTATSVGQVMGTLAYMPPEQALGDTQRVGPASDQFAMAITLQELITLQPARDWELPDRTLEQASRGLRNDMPGWVPAGLRAIVARGAAPRPEDRYRSMQALADDVRRFIHDEPLEVMPDNLPRRLWRRLDAHRGVVLGALLVLVLAVGSLSILQVRAALEESRAQARHEQHMAQLFAAVSGRAQALDQHARGLEMQLAMVAGAVGEALTAPVPAEFEPLRPQDLLGPDAPADTAYVDRFDQRVSFERPVYVRGPGADPVAAAADEARLSRVERELAEAFAGTGTLPGTVAEDGETPAHWVYAATPAGVMINYPGAAGIEPDYDPRRRPWYPATAGTRGPRWGAVYGDAAGSGTLMPCNRAIYGAGGELQAVVGIDFHLDDLRELLHLPVLPGYRDAWLLDGSGRVVARASTEVDRGRDAEDEGVRALALFPHAGVLDAIAAAPPGGQRVDGDDRYIYARVPALGFTYVAAVEAR